MALYKEIREALDILSLAARKHFKGVSIVLEEERENMKKKEFNRRLKQLEDKVFGPDINEMSTESMDSFDAKADNPVLDKALAQDHARQMQKRFPDCPVYLDGSLVVDFWKEGKEYMHLISMEIEKYTEKCCWKTKEASLKYANNPGVYKLLQFIYLYGGGEPSAKDWEDANSYKGRITYNFSSAQFASDDSRAITLGGFFCVAKLHSLEDFNLKLRDFVGDDIKWLFPLSIGPDDTVEMVHEWIKAQPESGRYIPNFRETILSYESTLGRITTARAEFSSGWQYMYFETPEEALTVLDRMPFEYKKQIQISKENMKE